MKSRILSVVALGACCCCAAPLELGLGMGGEVRVGTDGALLGARIHREGWHGTATGVRTDFAFPDAATGTATFEMFESKEKCADGRATLLKTSDGRVFVDVAVTSCLDQNPEIVVLSLTLPCSAYAGGTWKASNGKEGVFPKTYGQQMHVYDGTVAWVEFASAAKGAKPFRVAFPAPTRVLVQDDRQWCQTITLRIYPTGAKTSRRFRAGDQRSFSCFISSEEGVTTTIDKPVVVSAGPDWIPLDYKKDVLAGSALDFSGMGLQDAPAGKYGWLKNAGGHFEFEGRPGRPQRFYGVNLCFDACFPDKAFAEKIATRLARLGYNTVRIHHYESANGVIKGSADRLTINAAQMDRLDYLLAKFYEKGIYVTTDLYTCRPVMNRDVGVDQDGLMRPQVYKNMIGVHEPAFENWKTFARNLLTHVNPYTGRRYADEPGLPLISLINEGHLTWCWAEISKTVPMKAAWRKWLAERRAKDPAFGKNASDDAEKAAAYGYNAELILFMADVEERLVGRQREFLKSLGVKALLTSQNCGGHFTPLMAMRERCYDYVDDHFYVDHPHFLARSWALPSSCGNQNPVLSSSLPPVSAAFTRMPDKPFTITEWNFSGPGMFRGVGGIMTGALSALQGWDGLWRFAYSHGLGNMEDGKGFPGYFDVASDPLGQASDRASVCLFLRGDMAPLADSLAQMVTADTFTSNRWAQSIVPKWRNAAWNARVGTAVAPVPAGTATCNLAQAFKSADAPVALKANPSLSFDRERGSFAIDTPRTAGGFTPSGALAAGAVSLDVGDVAATVWASSLDGLPIARSRRLLVSHLTDVQADGNVYADAKKTVLLKWGKASPIVRKGTAKVSIAVERPEALSVWALETTGRRLERIPAEAGNGRLSFTAAVAGPHGARMLYEVAER